jgi:hypothetical protein
VGTFSWPRTSFNQLRYQQVFRDDWDKRATAIAGPSTAIAARPGAATPPGMVRISWHDYVDD